MHSIRNILILALVVLGSPSTALAQGGLPNSAPTEVAEDDETKMTPNTDLFALMTGRCSTLSVAGRDFTCRTVAYVHNANGRAHFTVAIDDPADHSHIISFSGENSKRTSDNLYDLTVDRMLLNSKHRPKADGIPVPAAVKSAGRCVQLGNFATLHVSSVVCSATDRSGKEYHLRFESDGSPIAVRRVNPSAPTISLER